MRRRTKSFAVSSLFTRKTIVRPSGDSTAAGPASTIREPGTPMLLTTRVTGAGTLGCAHGPSSAPTSATSAATVIANRIHGMTVRADRDVTAGAVPAAAAAPPAMPRRFVRALSAPRRCRAVADAGRVQGSVRGASGRRLAWREEGLPDRLAAAERPPSCRRRPRP